MTSIEIKDWQRDTGITAIVRATFPDYRRKTIRVVARREVCLSGLNWSGGSRSEYRACTLSGIAIGDTSHYSRCAPWANPAEGQMVQIPSCMVVVSGGHFCGKVSMLTLYVPPQDMPKLFPALA